MIKMEIPKSGKVVSLVLFLLLLGHLCVNEAKIQKGLSADFEEWMRLNGKVYKDQFEAIYRLKIFRQNVDMIRSHNKGNHSYTLEVNKFADLSSEEFENIYLTQPQNCSATASHALPEVKLMLPNHVDWRDKGVVPPVKDQGECGSCWAFSTVGSMEIHMAIKYGQKFNLSEQQLIDCAGAFDNYGCHGGLPSHAFEYIHYSPGIETETSYPYTAMDGKCQFTPNHAVAFVKDIVNITVKDELQMQEILAATGPVSIAYDVAKDFQFYKSGVYKSTLCKSDPAHTNHAVVVVGYGTDPSGIPYWIVRNSWGAKWGMDGYFMIERGKNMCGLADCASYPVVSAGP